MIFLLMRKPFNIFLLQPIPAAAIMALGTISPSTAIDGPHASSAAGPADLWVQAIIVVVAVLTTSSTRRRNNPAPPVRPWARFSCPVVWRVTPPGAGLGFSINF
uniref:Uncharacterized protein n=1 Tax=Glossina austeni TaxID=7395 RepID=A0A1A9VB57_GLOAU